MLLKFENFVGSKSGYHSLLESEKGYISYTIRTGELREAILSGSIDFSEFAKLHRDNNNILDDLVNINSKCYRFTESGDFRQEATYIEHFVASIFGGVVEQVSGESDTVFYDFIIDGKEYVSMKSSASAKYFNGVVLTNSPTKLYQYINFIFKKVLGYNLQDKYLIRSIIQVYQEFHGKDVKGTYKDLEKSELLYVEKNKNSGFIFDFILYGYEELSKGKEFSLSNYIREKRVIKQIVGSDILMSVCVMVKGKDANSLNIIKTKGESINHIADVVTKVILGEDNLSTSWGKSKQLVIQQSKIFNLLFPSMENNLKIKTYKAGEGFEDIYERLRKLDWLIKKKILKGIYTKDELNDIMDKLFKIVE